MNEEGSQTAKTTRQKGNFESTGRRVKTVVGNHWSRK